MKRVFLVLTTAALLLPTAALAKGPSGASIDGPGSGGITFGGESGGTPLGDLAKQAGFFPEVFGQQPDPMLERRPKGELGPRYTITYTVPGPNNELDKLRQDVYPYASSGPVTYMKPGQTFFGTQRTRGGWFQAGPELKTTLVAAGLPSTAAGASSSGRSFPTDLVALLGAGLALAAATALAVRRRARPRPSAA